MVQLAFSLSQALSLSSALPRCEMRFFSALSISAYVWPWYSKHESQPTVVQLVTSRQTKAGGRLGKDIPKVVGPRDGTIIP